MKKMTRTNRRWLSGALGGVAAIGIAAVVSDRAAAPLEDVKKAAMTAPVVSAPAVAVEAAVQAMVDAGEPVTVAEQAPLAAIGRAERERLAAEMARWVTRDPRPLVEVVSNFAETEPMPVPPTLLLSIAWAETRGKILAVSPAGAAGLAQATPAAYLLEGFDGKLFVTNQYLIGTRSYIMKKPLGDAMNIVDRVIRSNTPATRRHAKELLAQAKDLRLEGVEELEALRPVANETFFQRIEEADAHNVARLNELGRLIDGGASTAALRQYQTRIRGEYRQMMNVQRQSWKAYEVELTKKRDEVLRAHYGTSAASVIQNRPYEAGEYLGEVLDARFSPTQMVRFLAAHLSTKQQQAIALGVPDEKLEAWTAALYNGGGVNVKRMRAGLMSSLRETEDYMSKVPARRALLDRVRGAA
jgi:hypothetical protein